jgi:hypothetical protein
MKRHTADLVQFIINPFMGYLAPQMEDSFSFDRYASSTDIAAFTLEKLSLLIFVIALTFIAVISPILCFSSLFIEVHLEGLWYFWIITFFEAGYSLWLLLRRLGKKEIS